MLDRLRKFLGDDERSSPASPKEPARPEPTSPRPGSNLPAAWSTSAQSGTILPQSGTNPPRDPEPDAAKKASDTAGKSPDAPKDSRVTPGEPSDATKNPQETPKKSPEPGKDAPKPPEKSSGTVKMAPDAPVRLPEAMRKPSDATTPASAPVEFKPPTIAVTVPASAGVSAPADKVKAAPAQALPASPPRPAGEGRGEGGKPLGSSAPAPAKTPPSSPSPQPSPSEAEGARSTANVPAASSRRPDAPAPSGASSVTAPGSGVASPTAAGSTPALAPAAPKPATWKNLPAKDPWCPPAIAAQAPELRKVAAADAVAFERVLPGWRAAGASRRGRMHANGGTHREDSLAFDAHDRATVLCVSDGAGSCQHSRIGSHVAAHRVVEMLLAVTEKVDLAIAADATKLKEYLTARVTEAVLAATDALLELAKKSGCAPKDFRCTLLTALHYRGEKHELLFTNQIGDGAICLLRTDKTTARLGASDSGTHSGEVSCFVPDDCARMKAKAVDVISDVAPIECVLLCSDGIEDPFYPLEKQAADIFRQYYAGVTQPLKDFKAQPTQPAPLLQESAAWGLAQWLEFEKRGENDDRTVAVLHRLPQTISF